jgi:adenine/guanine phosphoribosyltransferase-like PRPP-binding protein
MLWPERYAKHGKHWTQNISKVYKPPAQNVQGKMVLILDDICTTGNTLAATMSAVLAAGGYPAACAYA